MNFALYGIRYTVCKMNGKRVENSIEIRAYIKARSVFSLMPVDIHLEVCDIYEGGGEKQTSHRSVCRWVSKLNAGVMQINDPPLQNDSWVIPLRRGMTKVIILRIEMTPRP